MNEILVVGKKEQEKFLRKKTVNFDFTKFKKSEVNELVARMRRAMRAANGIGLSANQIGLPYRVFIVEIPDAQGGNKFYAVFNPKVEKVSEETELFEEGCLSVPGKWGEVERPGKIILSGLDKNGRLAKVKAWGLLARVFQHELDHLDGKLFIDRTKNVYGHEGHAHEHEARSAKR